MNPTFNLQIKPDWSKIDAVRTRAAEFLGQHKIARDVVDAVSMVVCELVENAIKYGHFDPPAAADIGVTIDVEPRMITVEVKNPAGRGQDDNLSRLDRMIQWIRGYQDPFQAYFERIRVISAQSLRSRESGLGLVRIAYEGQSVLDFYIGHDDVLAVSAAYHLDTADRVGR